MDNNGHILEMTDIVKEFPGVIALQGISFYMDEGETFAIVGENGAGKSTLIKILSGNYGNDFGGTIKFFGKNIKINNPRIAQDLGINTIHQETALVSDISIAENIFLGRMPVNKFGMIMWRQMFKKSEELLDKLRIELNPRKNVRDISPAQRQLVEIAKACFSESKILIMDEPTSAIADNDIQHLFDVIQEVKKKGTAVIYISHKLKEVFAIADRVMVMRDGKTIKISKINEITDDELIRNMVGRDIEDLYGGQVFAPNENVVFEVRNISRRGKFSDISFTVREGEILGLSGLVGAGRSEIVRSIYGLDKIDSGNLLLDGREITVKNTTDAIDKGFAFVSEDRRIESVIKDFSIKHNITIIILKKLLNKLRLLDPKKEYDVAIDYSNKFSIKTPSVQQTVNNLSGGNQQKVAIAKSLSTSPKILILDEPTKGIDVGAKREIYILIKELASRGLSVIIVSSELPEIMRLCHRVVSVSKGKVSRVFEKDELNEEDLMFAAFQNFERNSGVN
jgi:ribose transport system ATP-binding protein